MLPAQGERVGRGKESTVRLHLVVGTGLLLLLLAGCALSSDPGSASPPPATTQGPVPADPSPAASPSPSSGDEGVTLPDDLRTRPAVAAAIADTADRAEADPGQVVIAAWSPVTWSDGSLGCPRKGMSYTQAMVEGELLMLRVGSSLYQYHAKTGGPFAYCASPSSDYTVG